MVIAAAVTAAGTPALSQAATFAYVNQEGEVRTVTADAAMTALATAPNIDEHSGVLLIDSASDEGVVGDRVLGV